MVGFDETFGVVLRVCNGIRSSLSPRSSHFEEQYP